MTERAIQKERPSELDRTWSLAQQAFIEERCATPASVDAYNADLKRLKKFLQARNIDSWQAINASDLLSFFQRPQLISSQKYSEASKDRHVGVVRGFFYWLNSNTDYPVKEQILETLSSIRSMRPAKGSLENRDRFTSAKLLSPSELERIAASSDSRDQALFRLLMTGIRLTQLEQLTVQNVKGDLTSPHPRLKIKLPQIIESQSFWKAKSLDDESSLALKKYFLEREKEKGALNPNDPLLIHKGGPGPSEKLSRQGMWMIVKLRGEEVDIPCNPRLLMKSARLLAK